jgi:hypothetical protein
MTLLLVLAFYDADATGQVKACGVGIVRRYLAQPSAVPNYELKVKLFVFMLMCIYIYALLENESLSNHILVSFWAALCQLTIDNRSCDFKYTYLIFPTPSMLLNPA